MLSHIRPASAGPARQALDTAEIRRALALLVGARDGDHVELRGITKRPSPERNWVESRVRPAGSMDVLLAAVAELAPHRGIYLCLNPVHASVSGSVNDGHVLRRCWLFIDIDPTRPDASNTDATEAERAAGADLALSMSVALSAERWPLPLIVDSGNGHYLLYRVDLPNDAASKALCQVLLHRLGARFDTAEATIDRTTYNASRIGKLPGTWSQKGPGTPERPHRLCRIVDEPTVLVPVPFEALLATAGLVAGDVEAQAAQAMREIRAAKRGAGSALPAAPVTPIAVAPPVPQPFGVIRPTATPSVIDRALAYLATIPGAVSGGKPRGGHATTLAAARALVWEFDLGAEQGFQLLWLHYNPRCQPPWTEAELRHKCIEADTVPFDKPRGHLVGAPPAPNGRPTPPPAPAPDSDGPLTIGANEIVPEDVHWLWPNILPLGKAVTWAGQTSMGKSFLLMDVAARLSVGGEIPLAGGDRFTRAGTLVLNTEDGYADTLVPRLIQAGADLTRIRFVKVEKLALWTLAHLDVLEKAIKEVHNCRLVIIDPASAHLGGVDDHKNAELRQLLMPLMLKLPEWGIVLVMVTHFNKAGAGKVEVISRVMGGVAWMAAVRSGAAFIPAPIDTDKKRRLFVPLKNNNGPLPKAMAYRIEAPENSPKQAVVRWLEQVDVTADEAMDGAKSKPARVTDAAAWLRELFGTRTAVASAEIYREAKEAGISDNALREAKRVLEIKARKVSPEAGVSYWMWQLPDANTTADPFSD